MAARNAALLAASLLAACSSEPLSTLPSADLPPEPASELVERHPLPSEGRAGTLAGPKALYDGSLDDPRFGFPIGAIRWPAWTSDDAVMFGRFVPKTTAQEVYVDYGHRRPVAWDDFHVYGPGIDTQAIIDAEILQAFRIIDWWQYDWYPNISAFASDPGNIPPQAYINTALDCHRKSPYRRLVKYALMLQPGWMSYATARGGVFGPDAYAKMPAYIAEIAAIIAEPNYMRINDRPILGVYGYASMTALQRAEWIEQLSLLLDALPPIWLIVQDYNTAGAQDMGAHYKTTYGPNPLLPSGATQLPFAEQHVRDLSSWNPLPGLKVACSLTPVQDRRPWTGGPTSYVDQPTMPELMKHISAAFNYSVNGVRPDFMLIYSWDEMGEGGPGIAPTQQEGTRYLDAIDWARTGIRPDSYSYALDAAQHNFKKLGSWTRSRQIPGMFNHDEITSNYTGDRVEFSHERALELGVVATTGPDRGIAHVYIDGLFQQAVDLYSPLRQLQQLVWNSSRLTGKTHTITVEVSGKKHPLSSSTLIGYDASRITFEP